MGRGLQGRIVQEASRQDLQDRGRHVFVFRPREEADELQVFRIERMRVPVRIDRQPFPLREQGFLQSFGGDFPSEERIVCAAFVHVKGSFSADGGF